MGRPRRAEIWTHGMFLHGVHLPQNPNSLVPPLEIKVELADLICVSGKNVNRTQVLFYEEFYLKKLGHITGN